MSKKPENILYRKLLHEMVQGFLDIQYCSPSYNYACVALLCHYVLWLRLSMLYFVYNIYVYINLLVQGTVTKLEFDLIPTERKKSKLFCNEIKIKSHVSVIGKYQDKKHYI